MAINHPNQIVAEDISDDLALIENEVKIRFDKTIEAIHTQDADIAQSLMEGYREQMTGISDDIVNNILINFVNYTAAKKKALIDRSQN